jgi:hypothetical protein
MTASIKNPKYSPVGVCIYCGTREGRLTDEHIIPFGLGGTWILPKASCLACAKVTAQVEQFCQRPMLGKLRIRLALPTRRPKDRREKLPLEFVYLDGRREERIVPASEVPFACMGFRFPAPGILRGQAPTNQFEGELVLRFVDEELRSHLKERVRLKLGSFNDLTFSRMLAKIAHSYAVASLGLGSFRPLLPDTILGRSKTAAYLVGGDTSGPAIQLPSMLHDVVLQDCVSSGHVYTLAGIQLFAFVGMPRYHVVVGEKFGPPAGIPMT